MPISARIIADSVCPAGIRLTTFELRYPRIIHSELMTHRTFSRNARSSRAVPTKIILEEVREHPFVPTEWGKNCRGMQAAEVLDDHSRTHAVSQWYHARDDAVRHAEALLSLGVHKQVVNRLLEPFSWIDVLVTSTDWNNWWALRDHPDAQPEIQRLARAMREAYDASLPRLLAIGEWHTPYADNTETESEIVNLLVSRGLTDSPAAISGIGMIPVKVSAARCRRISYRPFDGSDASVAADLERFEEMVAASPIHASPMEHQAMATGDPRVRSGNFRGWIQFRQTIKDHDVPK